MLKALTEALQSGQELSPDQCEQALVALLDGDGGVDAKVAFLGALADKGESVGEITAFAKVLYSRCTKVELDDRGVDLCGTGGSGLERFNVSTTAAFLLASLGVPVVKHGNRGSRKGNGSFDLLESLGVNFDLSMDRQKELYAAHGLCFLFARAHHPTVKAVGPARAQLGRRNIFNLIGPLSNPAGVKRQILGVSDPRLGPVMAGALGELGRQGAVVHGAPGIDELSMAGESQLWWVCDGEVSEQRFHPSSLDLEPISWEALPKGDASDNAKTFEALLKGDPCGGWDAMVALNAAAAMTASADHGNDLKGLFGSVLEHLHSGKCWASFEEYRQATL